MKLFIDTSNKKFILGLINKENKVIDFLMLDTNNDMVQNSNHELDKFLTNNKIKLLDIEEFYTTIGPGSFTGLKVSYNIINTVNLVKPMKKINVINSLKLQLVKGDKYSAIRFSKEKYYIIKNYYIGNKYKVVHKDNLPEDKISTDYNSFNKEQLEMKLSKFKRKNFNKYEMLFPKNTFITKGKKK